MRGKPTRSGNRDEKTTHGAVGIDVRDISSNTGSAADIVEVKGGDLGVELEEEGQGLADASAGAEDGDLVLAGGGRGELAGLGGERACGGAGEHGWRRE